jgi:hypothetical protein
LIETAFFVIAAGLLGYGLVSGRLQNTIVTEPMVFVVFGFVVSQHGLGLLHV